MSYEEFRKSELSRMNTEPLFNLLDELKGKKVLVYMHDDPDGLTSGLIFTRLLTKLGIDFNSKIPETIELEESRLKNDLGEDSYEAVFLLDKATMGYYDKYFSIINNFVVIDHHPLIGEEPKNIIVVNPQLGGGYKSCSNSFIVHMIASELGKTDIFDDFLAVIGLKGDWAVEPATDMVSEYVKDFYDEKITGTFNNLIEKISSKPTMFEFQQRETTTLLNQITELFFALGGGGFQYFYNDRDEELKDLDQPVFAYEVLKGVSADFNYKEWKTLDDFINGSKNSATVRKIFNYYLKDWESTIGRFDSSELLMNLGNVEVHLFQSENVPLMPMAGSVHVGELKAAAGDKEITFIMINRELTGSVHFSIRGTTPKVHAGKICGTLAKRLSDKFGHPDQITGGGHPFAAECRTRKSGVSFEDAMSEFRGLMNDIKKADQESDSSKGLELGLDYLGNNN